MVRGAGRDRGKIEFPIPEGPADQIQARAAFVEGEAAGHLDSGAVTGQADIHLTECERARVEGDFLAEGIFTQRRKPGLDAQVLPVLLLRRRVLRFCCARAQESGKTPASGAKRIAPTTNRQ
ncbi:hypothetical protein HBF32_13060 [Luteibacter yeojuensis]|uniref:Uncharacterized protein n=1 Tax=Luteibacter yeojuensis TaxID=345309 RepID=A0A7X5QW34_9GAMM|nr:hypothetical protein [Luteibacter yeojuensis]